MQPGNPQEIIRRGWCQGSVLPADFSQELVDEGELTADSSADLLIVITHDCDLVNLAYNAEPFVEILHAAPASKNGNLFHGKNPRKIQFETGTGNETDVFEVSIHRRYLVERRKFENFDPDPIRSLDQKNIYALTRWVAKRYTRSAFPDTFNERVNTVGKEFEKILKKRGEYITGLFIALDPWSELSDDEEYTVILVATVENDSRTDEQLTELYQAIDEIGSLLDTCSGLHVVEGELVFESDFSLANLRTYSRFEYDYLSLREKPGGKVAEGD